MDATTPDGVKFAGAGWLNCSREAKDISPIGVKVANVLGQVYQGLYNAPVNHEKVSWSYQIPAVTVYGSLSTYDDPRLTVLVLACLQAELEVGIYGSFKGYSKLIFNRSTKAPDLSDYLLYPASRDESPRELLGNFVHPKKRLEAISNGEIWSTEGLNWIHLLQLVTIAHKVRYRFEIQGRSPQSLSIMVSRREREGAVHERHPGWDEHREILRPYWDINYTSFA
jgi:hypothetical protein